MVSEGVIIDTFRDEFKAHGWKYVYVSVVHFNKFKIKWSRNGSMVDLEISDYLTLAPLWFVEETAQRLRAKFGGAELTPSARYTDWLNENRHLWTKK